MTHVRSNRSRKSWSDLTPGQRAAIIVMTAVETGLKIAMLVDLRRRPATQVRGPKRAWATGALVNTAGLVPVLYFVVGRRREQGPDEVSRSSAPEAVR